MRPVFWLLLLIGIAAAGSLMRSESVQAAGREIRSDQATSRIQKQLDDGTVVDPTTPNKKKKKKKD